MSMLLLLALACDKEPIVEDTAPVAVDADGDGFTEGEDCNDADPEVNPNVEEIVYDGVDNDCDARTLDDDLDSDGFLLADDCDDQDSKVNPGRTEVVYNGKDDDCDPSTIDDDLDGDGYGIDEDCADHDPARNPAAEEICDGVDNDCDGQLDNGSSDVQLFYQDQDLDGYGNSTNVVEACVAPEGYTSQAGDCKDLYPEINPGMDEVCDHVDNNCDGVVDGEDAVDRESWYVDADGDGYGDPATEMLSCQTPGSEYVKDGEDCDDQDAFYNPDTVWWVDYDGDGYGDSTVIDYSCEQPSGYVLDDSDCIDYNKNIYPGAPETCDGLDNDCDSSTSEEGTVGFLGDKSGTLTDLTTNFAAGADKAPASWKPKEHGTLEVCGGTWYVTIKTSYDLDIVGNGSETTVLDAGKRGSNLHVNRDNVVVTLDGVTLQRGKARKGGGIRCDAMADISGSDVVINDGIATVQGGLVYLSDECSLSLSDFELSEGWAWEDGGAVYLTEGSLELVDGTVGYNEADEDGGAFEVIGFSDTYDVADSRVLSLQDVLVHDNVANRGGGLWLNGGSTVTCTATSSSVSAGFVGNEADQRGGAVRFSTDGSQASFTSTTCDFGTEAGGDDNSPSDIEILSDSYDYGDDVSFSCDEEGCE
ncbi:MAG: putative metal-binding motif-containing protein [Myxococcota bacterium]|nr:putative metal-binding motif-containing protein [Myxococcota bacterium]